MTQEEIDQGFEEPEDQETLAAMNLEDTMNLIKDSDRDSLYEGREDE